MIRALKVITVSLFVFLLCTVSFGQGTDASLTGIVTDPSHAAVASAKVTARNKSTNWSETVTTEDSGFYSFLNLPIGPYVITVEQNGFNTATVELTLETAQKARQDANSTSCAPLRHRSRRLPNPPR